MGIKEEASVNDSTSTERVASELLFATPIFRRTWPDSEDLNAYLRELFLRREEAEKRSDREYSNIGGWHSPIDLQESLDLELLRVLQRARELAMDATEQLLSSSEALRSYSYSISAWANISREGHYNVPHVHMATWSAVYYVSLPVQRDTDPRAGALELIDPRPPTAMLSMPGRFFATRHVVKPEPGLMVLFPASIMHLVHPFHGEGERISIACDLDITY